LTALYSFIVIKTIVLVSCVVKIHEGLMPKLAWGIGHDLRQFISWS